MGGIETAVKVLANTFSVLTSLSPAPSLYKAYRAKDLGELSALPLVSMFINNFSWYAALSFSTATELTFCHN